LVGRFDLANPAKRAVAAGENPACDLTFRNLALRVYSSLFMHDPVLELAHRRQHARRRIQ
jgi:hypothetical protein